MYRYTVRCEFSSDDQSLPRKWLEWLQVKHIQDVLNAGATAAEIVEMDGERPTWEIRYEFPDRSAFETYIRDFAPGLREEGLRKFPLERGLNYARTSGRVIHKA